MDICALVSVVYKYSLYDCLCEYLCVGACGFYICLCGYLCGFCDRL